MNHEFDDKVQVPAPTAWPMVLAFGLTLIFAGMVTAASVSILGAVLAGTGAVGWFRDVLPVEAHESLPVVHEEVAIETSRDRVERVSPAASVTRAWLPVKIHPISAGVKGGLAGGAVMALVASAYGVVRGHGIWYAMSLLVAGLFPRMATETASQLGAFDLQVFLAAVPLHLLISLLVGLLYGAMLPMLPRHPILLGGFIAPLLWTGLIYGMLAFVNPVMNQRIDWLWFVLSQSGFGIVAGVVVTLQERILTSQNIPLAMRIGIEAPGLVPEHEEGPKR